MGTATSLQPASPGLHLASDVAPVTFEVLGAAAIDAAIPEWDTCASAADNAFQQTPWFAATVWTLDVARRGDLFLVTGRDAAGSVQAVSPFWLSRSRVPLLGLRTLQPLTLHAQETSSIVVGAADRADATARLADFLLGPMAPSYDVLHFGAIDPGSLFFAALLDSARRLDLPVVCGEPVANPVIRVVPGADDQLPGASPRFRRNLSRAWRRVQESGVELECREMSWDWDAHRDAVARIYRERWGEGPVGTTFALHDAGTLDVLSSLLRRLDRYFRAHAFGAFVDGRLAAYVVCFRGGEEVTLWAACVDERHRRLSVGMVLWDYCLREIVAWPGVARINFLKGGDRFKVDWADRSYAVCDLAIVRATGLRRRRALWHYGR